MKKVEVKTALKKYLILIDNGIFQSLPQIIEDYAFPKRIFTIIDRKVDSIHGTVIRKVIDSIATKKFVWTAPSSERLKSFKTIYRIFSYLFDESFGRDTLFIVIGGGTIGDVAGFASSIYMRGVPLIHVPTTLLSAVDSSIGGKTGINFMEAKNLIGTFYHPELVLTDINFLNSLPDTELVSGFGEVIKYSYLSDEKFYSSLLSDHHLLLERNPEFLEEIIFEGAKIKSSVVSNDEFEKTGLRMILNFGHTFAHAFESNSGFNLSHGKAVIAGIICSLHLSYELKLINKDQLNYMLRLPLKFKPESELKNINEKEVFRLMNYDKKNQEGRIKFVLIKNFGEIVVDVDADKKTLNTAMQKVKKILV
jgi:3-dehydroquinate synthase